MFIWPQREKVTETVMEQLPKLVLVSEILLLFLLHTKPDCTFLSSSWAQSCLKASQRDKTHGE